MIDTTYELTKIYEKGDTSEKFLAIDSRFRYITITVQPLNLVGSPDLLDTDELLVEANAANAGVTGTITLQCTPPKTFKKYDLGSENVIDLSLPHFLNTNVPINALHPTFAGISGCTHIAVSITAFAD